MPGDAALQNGRLLKATENTARAAYTLHCDGAHGTTGNARRPFEPDRLGGTLHVRLGGKNPTFRRVVARALRLRPAPRARPRTEALARAATACADRGPRHNPPGGPESTLLRLSRRRPQGSSS